MRIWVLLAVLVAAPVIAGKAEKLDEETRFCGGTFGGDLASFSTLIHLAKDENGDIYWRPDVKLEECNLGKTSLTRAIYVFLNGKLYAVATGSIDRNGLLSELKDKYGKGEKMGKDIFVWESNKIRLVYNWIESTGTATIVFYDLAAHNRLLGINNKITGGGLVSLCPPGKHYVSGYSRKNGVRVKGHCRS